MAPLKAIQYRMNNNGPRRHKSFTHIEHRACGLPRGFGALNSSPHWVAGLTPTYLLPATGQIGVPTASKYGAKPIPYVTLHFRDRHDANSLRRRNRAATTVLVCEQKPYRLIRYDFRGGEKAFRCCEYAVITIDSLL